MNKMAISIKIVKKIGGMYIVQYFLASPELQSEITGKKYFVISATLCVQYTLIVVQNYIIIETQFRITLCARHYTRIPNSPSHETLKSIFKVY